MGHTSKIHKSHQLHLIRTHTKNRYAHGGELRKTRAGRGSRPLSTISSLHLVFKANRHMMRLGYRSPLGFKICNSVIKRYAKRFFVKIEELAICSEHIHLSVRFSKRSLGQHFLRVVAGQIAQQMKKNGLKVTDTPKKGIRKKRSLWKHRVFSRVTRGWRDGVHMMLYVRLNRKEAEKKIPYRKERLKGLSSEEWELLWS
jgi:REP element-mobilizing transposase RayT